MPNGNDFIILAQKHIGEKYVLGCASPPLKNPNYKGPWDCSEFVTWCVYQVSGISVGSIDNNAYTGYWVDDIPKKCLKISIEEAMFTPGAILLRAPIEKGANKRMGHIVFSDGNGNTIEAMGTKEGVRRGKISGRTWDFALLIKGIDYTQNSESKAKYEKPKVAFRLTNPVIEHDLVLQAKKNLSQAGIDVGEITPKYDENMQRAVYNYQVMKGLMADGILGPQTLKSLKVVF